MKIKKLFHWLYAILMLLPVFYIGGRVLYTIFNKNAKDSYSGEVSYKYSLNLNEYRSKNGIVLQSYTLNSVTNYYYDFGIFNQNSNGFIVNGSAIYGDNRYTAYAYNVQYIKFISGSTEFQYNSCIVTFSKDRGDDITGQLRIYENLIYDQTTTYIVKDYDSQVKLYDNGVRVYPTYTFNYITSFKLLPLDNYFYIASNYNLTETQNALSYYQTDLFYNTSALSEAFEYSVNQLNEVPLFSWAQNSFLNEPFTYISGLFGIAASNPINTMLSYWLSISIIWLVFDLVMYVPLLVHRWIDKGGLD